MPRLWPSGAAILLAFAMGCGSSEGPADASVDDAGPHPTPGVCLPGPGGTGNELHVGAYCTPGGGECSQYVDTAPLCAIDLDPEGDRFCIRVGCRDHEACGAQACCTGRDDNGPKACVPKGCLTGGDLTAACPPIPYADASVADAGTSTDAGMGDR